MWGSHSLPIWDMSSFYRHTLTVGLSFEGSCGMRLPLLLVCIHKSLNFKRTLKQPRTLSFTVLGKRLPVNGAGCWLVVHLDFKNIWTHRYITSTWVPRDWSLCVTEHRPKREKQKWTTEMEQIGEKIKRQGGSRGKDGALNKRSMHFHFSLLESSSEMHESRSPVDWPDYLHR